MIALETWRDQNREAYLVTDSTIMDRFRPGWVYDTSDKPPVMANSITELAQKMGIDPSNLEKTVSSMLLVIASHSNS